MIRSLTIFDIDDTLFRTTTKIHIVKNNRRIMSLSTAEYNVYKLKPGETHDLSDFGSAKHFYDEAKPVENVFHIAKRIMAKLIGPNKKFIIVTARADLDDKDLFLATFHKYGFPIDRSHIHRAGNTGLPSSEAKKLIISNELLNASKPYDIVRMFDDDRRNLSTFLRLKDDFPRVKFEALLINSDGTISRV